MGAYIHRDVFGFRFLIEYPDAKVWQRKISLHAEFEYPATLWVVFLHVCCPWPSYWLTFTIQPLRKKEEDAPEEGV